MSARRIGQLVVLLGCLLFGAAAEAKESVVFKLLAVNPSATESKEVTLKGELPPEVKPENVLDADGLEVEYDSQSGIYFVTGTTTLKPKDSVVKNVLIEDVWVVPGAQFDRLDREVDEILKKLQGTSFAERGQLMADPIRRRLDELRAHQNQPFLNPEQHISRYRDDLKALQLVETDMISLRQLMVMAALEPASQSVLAGTGASTSASNGPERGSLSIATTWRLIFLILGLLAFVSLSFFLVWQRQLKLQLARQTAHEDAEPAPDDLLTNGNGKGAAVADVPPPPLASPARSSSEPGRARIQPKSPLSS